MALQAIQLYFPSEMLNALAASYQESINMIREAAVLELYRQGKLSSGKAGEILGMEKFEFIEYSGKKGIPFIRISPEELEEEVKLLSESGCKDFDGLKDKKSLHPSEILQS